ncbi:MAG: hypothetical protein PF439_10405 [Helicobacteraceae bacterium]|nr:hypothetical protein [Helicobacteraceae bacterium]
MLNPNSELPQNLQDMIGSMNLFQAIPLGTTQGIPFIAIKLSTQNDSYLADNAITCEFKPSIFNITYQGENIAICFVQFRLNNSDKHIFTASYDLKNDKQYGDCYDLLAMKQYGLLVMTDNGHDFLQFDVDFEGDFNPHAMIHGARELGSKYDPKVFSEVSFGLSTQGGTPTDLWHFLAQTAPIEKKWYGAMQLGATKE